MMEKPNLTQFDGDPPSRLQPTTFSSRGDRFMAFMVTFVGQLQVVINYIEYGLTTAAQAVLAAAESSRSAEASATAASQIAQQWVPFAQYQLGQVLWSPVDFASYRVKVAHVGSDVDPSLDTVHWSPLSEVSHIYREDNPHGVNADQVGAYSKQEVDGLLLDVGLGAAQEWQSYGQWALPSDELEYYFMSREVSRPPEQIFTRFAGTNYVNNSGRSIALHVEVVCQALLGDLQGGQIIVDGRIVSAGAFLGYFDLQAIVPSGSTYRVDIQYGFLMSWKELR